MYLRLTVSIMIAASGLMGCQARSTTPEVVPVEGGNYRNVSAVELRNSLKSKDFLLINVHIPLGGSIPGTDGAIPYDEIGGAASQLPTDRDAKIVLYCRSGHMSAIAAQALVKLGYTNVWNLDGGTLAWEAAGGDIQQ